MVCGLLAQLGYTVPAGEVEERLDNHDASALVAEGDGRVVGVLCDATRWQLHKDGPVTSIDSLVVDTGFRSKGVGAAMADAVGAMARDQGGRLVDLHSDLSRLDARRFYERHGFAVTSDLFAKKP